MVGGYPDQYATEFLLSDLSLTLTKGDYQFDLYPGAGEHVDECIDAEEVDHQIRSNLQMLGFLRRKTKIEENVSAGTGEFLFQEAPFFIPGRVDCRVP